MSQCDETFVGPGETVSQSLHDQILVPPNLRKRHQDMIFRSLRNGSQKSAVADRYGRPSAGGRTLPIAGTFVPFHERDLCRRWSDPSYRATQYHLLKEIGLNTLILLTGNLGGVCYDSRYYAHICDTDLVDTVLKESSRLGMEIWIGLPHVEIAWMLQPRIRLTRLLETSRLLIEEIQQQYGQYDNFHGWYIPYELCNVFVEESEDPSCLPHWVNSIAMGCKLMPGDRPTAIAPYFTVTDGPDAFARLWENIVRRLSMVDVIMMQDSVGIFKEDRLLELPLCFRMLKSLAETHGKRLWADIEIFDQQAGVPLDWEPWTADPAPYERVIRQMQLVSEYVERIVTFSYFDYMNPAAGPVAGQLYRQYHQYLTSYDSNTAGRAEETKVSSAGESVRQET
ncbi:MAG TPA: DUF4434 domain-containing protein [bacterium]|nr:DUF4434 domain-containing protein [bacterium]HQL62342.1 DUF4434 domain-containing protein [bacterium]